MSTDKLTVLAFNVGSISCFVRAVVPSSRPRAGQLLPPVAGQRSGHREIGRGRRVPRREHPRLAGAVVCVHGHGSALPVQLLPPRTRSRRARVLLCTRFVALELVGASSFRALSRCTRLREIGLSLCSPAQDGTLAGLCACACPLRHQPAIATAMAKRSKTRWRRTTARSAATLRWARWCSSSW